MSLVIPFNCYKHVRCAPCQFFSRHLVGCGKSLACLESRGYLRVTGRELQRLVFSYRWSSLNLEGGNWPLYL
jgi:hypothetical protein